MTPFPEQFHITNGMVKYDGTSKPETWLSDYRVAVSIGGGNEYISMRILPLMLEGLAQAWLNILSMDSIHEQEDLEHAFLKNFQGMYKHPGSVEELWMCVQREGEPVRQYIQYWTQLSKSIKNVPKDQAINAFQHGVWYSLLWHKLARSNVVSMGRLMQIMKKYTTSEESLQYELRAAKGKAIAYFSGLKDQPDSGH